MSDLEGRKDLPLVSICIPTYNSQDTVKETLESVLGQTYRNIEVLVIDNKSTDRTVEVVRRFRDERLKVIVNEENIGAEGNFNKCIMNSSGEYTGIFHSDDIYDERIIEKQVNVFNRFEVGAVFTNGNYIDEESHFISKGLIPREAREVTLSFSKLFELVLKYENFMFTPSALIKTEVYRVNYPFNYSKYGTSSDLDMWLRVSKNNFVYIIDACLINYRISRAQGSYNYNKGRTKLSNYFLVMDHHMEQNNGVHYSEEAIEKYSLRKKRDMIKCNVNRILLGKNSEEYQVSLGFKDLRYAKSGSVLFLFFSVFIYRLFKNTILSRWAAVLINTIHNSFK